MGQNMAFRADEAAQTGYEEVESYLVGPSIDESERTRSKEALLNIINEIGPVIDAYPTWHPLVSNHNSRYQVTLPSKECGYRGLDHTRYFAQGFITCPYHDGQEVIDSVMSLPVDSPINITAEYLDIKLYSPQATPILVRCDWGKPLGRDRMIPISIAMPLILEKELPHWRLSEVAETWETMRPYFLGSPRGARSSLFVNQETGLAIKKIWTSLIYTGMFGPIYVD